MKMTVKERLLIGSILPPHGNLVTIKIMRELRENLSFSEEEIKELNIRFGETATIWDITKEGEGKEIPVGPKAEEIIKKALQEADNKCLLTDGHIEIYERFIPPDKKE